MKNDFESNLVFSKYFDFQGISEKNNNTIDISILFGFPGSKNQY